MQQSPEITQYLASIAALLPDPSWAAAAVAAGDGGSVELFAALWAAAEGPARAAAREWASRLGVKAALVPELPWVFAAAARAAGISLAVGNVFCVRPAAIPALVDVAPGALLLIAAEAPGFVPLVPSAVWAQHYGEAVAPSAADVAVAALNLAVSNGAAGWIAAARADPQNRAPPAAINRARFLARADPRVIQELGAWHALRPAHLVPFLRVLPRVQNSNGFLEKISAVIAALYSAGWSPAAVLAELLGTPGGICPAPDSFLRLLIIDTICGSSSDLDGIDWDALAAGAHSAAELDQIAQRARREFAPSVSLLRTACVLRAPEQRLEELASALGQTEALYAAVIGGSLTLAKRVFFGNLHRPRWFFRDAAVAELYAACPPEHVALRGWLAARIDRPPRQAGPV